MGDYSTIRVEGTVRREYRQKLRWFFEKDYPQEGFDLNLFEKVFSLDPEQDVWVVRSFLKMDRASFTLFGVVSYPLEASWYEEEKLRNKVGEDGYLLILGSSKNKETNDFFFENIVPMLFEPGYNGVVTDLR